MQIKWKIKLNYDNFDVGSEVLQRQRNAYKPQRSNENERATNSTAKESKTRVKFLKWGQSQYEQTSAREPENQRARDVENQSQQPKWTVCRW